MSRVRVEGEDVHLYTRDGERALTLTGPELLLRLAAVAMPPRVPLVRYQGAFAPNSPWRPGVVGSLPPGPTLLVLRVFQRDRQMAALFDTVITRWRLSGNTLLIAGTDVVSDTMDVDDLFTFVSGRLAERFVTRPADLPRRIAEFDLLPDADGRYRLNECYCSDSTWQAALQALVASARVVLMDLRGFAAHNAGCRFELRVLAESPAVTRVVVLCDGDTDLAVARAEAAQAAPGRFVWFDARALDRAASERVLAELCAGTAGAPAG